MATKTSEQTTGSRNTIQRALVLDAVNALHNHPTSAQVYEEVHRRNAGVSRATVYRNLHVLAQRGDILCVETPAGADRYDFHTTPHYHVMCTECGSIFDVDMPYISNLEDNIKDARGFIINRHDIVFQGICPSCAQAHQEESA